MKLIRNFNETKAQIRVISFSQEGNCRVSPADNFSFYIVAAQKPHEPRAASRGSGRAESLKGNAGTLICEFVVVSASPILILIDYMMSRFRKYLP
jgi:hypothetical protein